MRKTYTILSIVFAFIIVITLAGFYILWHVTTKFETAIYSPDQLKTDVITSRFADKNHVVAIVFGAGINSNNTPSDALADRIMTAAELYKKGYATKLVMSGDNRFVNYNEPEVMKQFAITLGVAEGDIVLDYAGRRTYDTCYRGSEIFGIKEAILVTQEYHLNRALYTCNKLGITSIGVSADRHFYAGYNQWLVREWMARIVAWFDVLQNKPAPVLGEQIEIFN